MFTDVRTQQKSPIFRSGFTLAGHGQARLAEGSVTLFLFAPHGLDVSLRHLDQEMRRHAVVVILFNNLVHRQVFMDGRKLEKDPNPSWMGYSVGHWDGDTLVVESNGYTTQVWLDADGHPHSEDLRITERFHRIDVGHMEIRMTLDDPKA